MKKVGILISVIIIIVFFMAVFNFNNSNSKLENVLNKKIEIPNNIYIKETMINNANTIITTETYKKDNMIYQHIENDDGTQNQDILFNFEKKQVILIDNFSKNIDTTEINENPLDNIFINSSNQYTYDGEETINDNNYIKFYLEKDANLRTYFYVDTNSGLLYQKEEGLYQNNTFSLYYKYNYTYEYNTVTDDNILKFDENNYSDYTK